jgi:hypothetical protein
MPYIEKSRRLEISLCARELADLIRSEGETNYAITMLIKFLTPRIFKFSYSGLQSAVGLLECVKQEFYRRAVAPYEDKKAIQNGDVY